MPPAPRHRLCRIFGAIAVLEPGMFRTHAGIIQTSRNGVGFDNLPILILNQISAITV